MCEPSPAERADHAAERASSTRTRLTLDRLAVAAPSAASAAGRRATDDARQPARAAAPPSSRSSSSRKIDSRWTRRLSSAGRADGEDPAVVDDGDPLAQLVGLGHVVGREQDRPAGDGGLPVDDQLADGAGGGHVEAERRLVEEQDPRVVEQAAGEVHLLALAGRQRADPLEALLAEADGLDQLVDPPPALACVARP